MTGVNLEPSLRVGGALLGLSLPDNPGRGPAPTEAAAPASEPRDTVSLSAAARLALQESARADDEPAQGELTEEEKAQVEALKARDREVRAHEQAHAAVGGAYAGAPTYEYQVGPDGNRYAVGGSVSIDTAPVDGDPEATIDKLEQVKAAALAPAEPSGQDRAVAAQADAGIQQAQAQLNAQKADELAGRGGEEGDAAEGAPEAQNPDEDPERPDIAAIAQGLLAYGRAAGLA